MPTNDHLMTAYWWGIFFVSVAGALATLILIVSDLILSFANDPLFSTATLVTMIVSAAVLGFFTRTLDRPEDMQRTGTESETRLSQAQAKFAALSPAHPELALVVDILKEDMKAQHKLANRRSFWAGIIQNLVASFVFVILGLAMSLLLLVVRSLFH